MTRRHAGSTQCRPRVERRGGERTHATQEATQSGSTQLEPCFLIVGPPHTRLPSRPHAQWEADRVPVPAEFHSATKKKPRFRNLSSFFVQTEPKSPPLKSARFITNRLVNRSIKPGEKNKRGKEKEGGEQARGRETWRGRVGGREGGRPSHSPAGFGSIWAAPHTQQAEISAGRKRQTHLRSSRRRRGHHW